MNLFVGDDGRLRAVWRFVAAVFVAYMANSLAAGLASRAGSVMSYAFEVVYRPALVALLLAGFSILLVVADQRPDTLRAMGLGAPWKQDILKGLLIGGGMVVVAAASIAVAGELGFSIGVSPWTGARVLVVVFILATAAMAEELAFRGYPFQRLIEAVGAWPAAVAMSALFGAVHLPNPHSSPWATVNTVLVGGLFCAAYLRTWKLWLPFGIHLGWNAMLGLVLGLPVSGLDEFGVAVRGKAWGPGWLTGGSYGIEASVTGTAVIMLGFLALVAFVPRVPAPQPPQPEPPLRVTPPVIAEADPQGGEGEGDRPPSSDAHPTE